MFEIHQVHSKNKKSYIILYYQIKQLTIKQTLYLEFPTTQLKSTHYTHQKTAGASK